jgi:hypothetical protein
MRASSHPTPCGFNQPSPPDERRFFFLGKLEVMPRNLSVMVANLSDQCAVSKPQILGCAGPILLSSNGGAPNVLAFFSIRGGEHSHAPLPRTPLQKLSGLSPESILPFMKPPDKLPKGAIFADKLNEYIFEGRPAHAL